MRDLWEGWGVIDVIHPDRSKYYGLENRWLWIMGFPRGGGGGGSHIHVLYGELACPV